MPAVYTRPLTAQERAALPRPGLFSRLFRRSSLPPPPTEAAVVSFDVRRVWDITACTPGCCPNSWLFETTDGAFVAVESWDHFAFKSGDQLSQHFRVEFLPGTGHVLSATSTGLPIEIEAVSVRDVLVDLCSREIEMLPAASLPEAFFTITGGA